MLVGMRASAGASVQTKLAERSHTALGRQRTTAAAPCAAGRCFVWSSGAHRRIATSPTCSGGMVHGPAWPSASTWACFSTSSSYQAASNAQYYLLRYNYVPDILERRGPHRPGHLAAAHAAHAKGQCILGGPTGSPPSGGIFVFKHVPLEVCTMHLTGPLCMPPGAQMRTIAVHHKLLLHRRAGPAFFFFFFFNF